MNIIFFLKISHILNSYNFYCTCMLNVGKFEVGYRLNMLVIPTKGDKLKNESYIVSLYLYL